jgi:uncharacterized membrane protein
VSSLHFPFPARRTGTDTPSMAYRGGMGKLILFLLAAIVLFIFVSAMISALHFLFMFAVIVAVIFGAVWLVGAGRRSSRQ